jgi:hypothetical protein
MSSVSLAKNLSLTDIAIMNDEDTTIPDSDASEATADDLEPPRPNKWQGAPSTWTTLTAQERGLVASLDQIRNADLSIHLFNAHALKRRAREFEENPEVCTSCINNIELC